MSGDLLIKAADLSVHFPIGGGLFRRKQMLRAVDSVNLEIPCRPFFGLVGESGSGKTTLGRAFLKAVPIAGGSIRYADGEVDYDLVSTRTRFPVASASASLSPVLWCVIRDS